MCPGVGGVAVSGSTSRLSRPDCPRGYMSTGRPISDFVGIRYREVFYLRLYDQAYRSVVYRAYSTYCKVL